MITKDQIEAGCEIWVVDGDWMQRSAYNEYPALSNALMDMLANDEGYFPSREEAELFILSNNLKNLNN